MIATEVGSDTWVFAMNGKEMATVTDNAVHVNSRPGAEGGHPGKARGGPRTSRNSWPGWILVLVALAALALGVGSLLQVSGQTVAAQGLVGSLPPGYFLALGLTLAGFVVTLGLRKPHPALLALQILVLVVILHGVDPIIYGLPRLEASYRHLGIADYIARTGEVDPTIDAYFNWPGFFAMLAMLSGATGVQDLSRIATWAPLGVNILLLMPLLALASRLTRNPRHAWASVWVFYLASWVGQDYLSPQASAYLLMIVLLACVLTNFRGRTLSGRRNRVTAAVRRIVTVFDPTAPQQRRVRLPRGDVIVLGVVCAMFVVAITAAHQLTPFALVLVLVAFVVTGRLRLRPLWLVGALFPVAWLGIVAAPYWIGHLDSLFGSAGSIGETTAKTVTSRFAGDAAHLFVVNARLAESALVLVLALIGALVARVRRLPWLTAALGAGTPVVLYAIQPYGGEVLMRLYLFALPFAAYLMVLPLTRKAPGPSGWLRGIGLLLLGSVLAGATLVTRYGNDAMENFTPQEISLVDHLYRVAPPGSVLIEAVHNTPWKFQQYAGYDYRTLMLAKPDRNAARLNCETVESDAGSKGAYLIVTESQVRAAETLGVGPSGDVKKFLDTCGTRPGWSIATENPGGIIYFIHGVRNGK